MDSMKDIIVKCRHCINEATSEYEGSHLCDFHAKEVKPNKLVATPEQTFAGIVVCLCIFIVFITVILALIFGGANG